jgi:hypothetical protein
VCHSNQPKGQPEHGKTTLTPADCEPCHHRQAIDPALTSLPPARKVDCQTCHAADALPRQVVYQQKSFDHKLHATRNSRCSTCHTNNVQQSFKADCISCHHDERKVKVEEKCGTCHPNQTAMFEGKGYNLPSLKLAARVPCEGCHQAETETISVATRNGCKSCHDKGDYAAVMDAWQTKTRAGLNELKATETKVAALLGALDAPEARQLYESAQKDIDFIQADASYGVHNPELADVLIMNAQGRLQKCLNLLSKAINGEKNKGTKGQGEKRSE